MAVSGTGLTAIAAGTVLATSGISDIPVADTIRIMLSGKLPTIPISPLVTSGLANAAPVINANAGIGGGQNGAAIAADALQYVGVPYRWGGADPTGWDCSGFVTWVLHHDLGYALPSNTHTVTGQFLTWGGAYTVPRAQCQQGDLVCWPGHIGIAVSATDMVNAPGTGLKTRVQKIWGSPVIRRVGASLTTPSGGHVVQAK